MSDKHLYGAGYETTLLAKIKKKFPEDVAINFLINSIKENKIKVGELISENAELKDRVSALEIAAMNKHKHFKKVENEADRLRKEVVELRVKVADIPFTHLRCSEETEKLKTKLKIIQTELNNVRNKYVAILRTFKLTPVKKDNGKC